MMSLPFFGLTAALLLAATNRRCAAMIAWALSMAGLLVLFRIHASDALDIVL